MRTLLPLLAIPLLVGCHGRFKKHAPDLGSVRGEVITVSGPSVLLPRSAGTDVVSVVFDVTQTVREGNIAAHIADKVDPEQVNAAFLAGFQQQLGDGPPFAYDASAGNVLQFELVDWGMEMWGFGNPGVYTYTIAVHGYRADGKKIYRSSFSCATDAGTSGWVEMSPFVGADNPNKIKNLPAEQIQAIFDATAEDCGRQMVRMVRQHAG